MLQVKLSWTALLVALAGCGSDDSGSDLKMGKCLSDADICQFQVGVSTKDSVQNGLGNAQQYLGANTWAYTCQEVNGQAVVHNDMVVFDFDANGVLSGVDVLRSGSGATPPPTCVQ